MKKILVTGGAGFIGTSLINNLLKNKYKVNCLDLSEPNIIKNKNFKFFKATIFNEKIVNSAMKECEMVIHLAAALGVENTDKNTLDCLDTNIYGTKKILQLAIKKKVKRFIFSSSSEVYGEQDKFPIREDAELKNKSIYATSKIVAEKYIQGFSKKEKISYNIVRFFNVYGRGQKENFVISKFIKNIKENKDLLVYGNGKQIRSFCNVEDTTNGIIQVIKNGKVNTEYNIGNNNEPISIFNLAKKMVRISGKKLKVKKIPYIKSDRTLSREIFKRYPDIKKIKSDTNFKPLINLETGIKQLLRQGNFNEKNNILSKIGIGTLQMGLNYGIANRRGKVSFSEIKKIKKIAKLNKINLLDTAHVYGDCEERIGKANFNGFDIVTKLPATRPDKNLSKWVEKSIKNAMKKIKTKQFYCLHVHNTKYLLNKNGSKIYKALVSAKNKGLIKKIGVSVYTTEELNRVLKKFKIDLVQLPFNIFDQRTIKLKTLEKLKSMGIEIHTRSTFLQGLLTMKQKDIPSKFNKYKKYFNNWDKLSKKTKRSKVEICLRYALSNPFIDKVILGIDSSSQFKQLISKSGYIKIDASSVDASKEINLINPAKW